MVEGLLLTGPTPSSVSTSTDLQWQDGNAYINQEGRSFSILFTRSAKQHHSMFYEIDFVMCKVNVMVTVK